MDLQVNMIRIVSLGENQGKQHIFGSGSCQSIVVDLNLRDELPKINKKLTKITKNCLPTVIIEKKIFSGRQLYPSSQNQ